MKKIFLLNLFLSFLYSPTFSQELNSFFKKDGVYVNSMVLDKKSSFSNDETFIYTTVKLKVLDIIKDSDDKPILEDTISLVYFGGSTDNGSFQQSDVNGDYLKISSQYILSLDDNKTLHNITVDKYYMWEGQAITISNKEEYFAIGNPGLYETIDDLIKDFDKNLSIKIDNMTIEAPYVPTDNSKELRVQNFWKQQRYLDSLRRCPLDMKCIKRNNEIIDSLTESRNIFKTNLNKGLRTTSNEDLTLEIKNPHFVYEAGHYLTSLDIYASSNSDIYLDLLTVFLRYNEMAFYPNLANQDLVFIEKSRELNNGNYEDITVLDQEQNLLRIVLSSNYNVNEGVGRLKLNGSPKHIYTIKLETSTLQAGSIAGLEIQRKNNGPSNEPIQNSRVFSSFRFKDTPLTQIEDDVQFANIKSLNSYTDYITIKPMILSFTPKNTGAGDNKTLTIKGYNFGNERNTDVYQVKFRSTKNGGKDLYDRINNFYIPNFVDLLDDTFYEWSDNEIRVDLKSDLPQNVKDKINNLDKYSGYIQGSNTLDFHIGSGYFQVQTDPYQLETPSTAEFDYSPEPIDIQYSLKEIFIQNNIYDLMVMPNNEQINGIEIFMGPILFANSEAVDAVQRAISDINCFTGANLSLNITQPKTRNANSQNDPFNDYVIEFSNNMNDFSNESVLGVTKYSPVKLCSGYPPYYEYAFILINQNKVKDFTYNTSVVGSTNRLYDIVLHEMGHVLGLNHINEYFYSNNYENGSNRLNSERIMYASYRPLNSNAPTWNPFEETYTSGLKRKMRENSSVNWESAPCTGRHINYKIDTHGDQCITPPSGMYSEIFESGLNYYPNPNNGILNLKTEKYKINSLQILNSKGYYISEHQIQTTTSDRIDISHLNPGIYFLKFKTSIGVYTKKLIML